MNYSLKIDLKKLSGAMLGRVNGVNSVIIPVEKNGIFCSDKGAAYIDLAVLELKQEGKFGDTHLVKRSLGKEERDKMTKEERDNQPILGGMKPFGGAGVPANIPDVSVDVEGDKANDVEGAKPQEDDDLPF